ncbi:MAG TPA: hypothetical protein VM901_01810 [Bdellovibrionota bacterium]|nr:hypothetical protein [Bdellovibrionota bacterium]
MKLASRPHNFVGTARGLLAVAVLSLSAHAKDLSGRLGMGISNVGGSTTEAVSVDWQLTQATSFEANLGLSTKGDNGGWDLGFRASRNLFIEENMLFSLFVGGALVQEKENAISATGYMLEAGLGSKFFIEGLPNLGFGFRGAFQMIDVDGMKLQIAPIFSSHYYF